MRASGHAAAAGPLARPHRCRLTPRASAPAAPGTRAGAGTSSPGPTQPARAVTARSSSRSGLGAAAGAAAAALDAAEVVAGLGAGGQDDAAVRRRLEQALLQARADAAAAPAPPSTSGRKTTDLELTTGAAASAPLEPARRPRGRPRSRPRKSPDGPPSAPVHRGRQRSVRKTADTIAPTSTTPARPAPLSGAAAVASRRARTAAPRRPARGLGGEAAVASVVAAKGLGLSADECADSILASYALRKSALAAPVPPELTHTAEGIEAMALRALDERLRRGRDTYNRVRRKTTRKPTLRPSRLMHPNAGSSALLSLPQDSVTSFMRSLGNTVVLDRTVEMQLTSIVQKGVHAAKAGEALAARLGRTPSVPEVVAELGLASPQHLQLLLANRQGAQVLMVQFNLRLVIHTAKRYTGLGLDMCDLISEGVAGLNRAIDKFDPQRGFRFSTYATWWVRQAITRSLSDQSRLVRLPVHIYDAVAKLRRISKTLNDYGSTEEYHKALSDASGIPVEKVNLYLSAARQTRSLDLPATVPKSGATKIETMNDSATSDMWDVRLAAKKPVRQDDVLRDSLEGVLASLPPRERNVLCMRYGLHAPDGHTMTLLDISAAYGVTTERIRQIEDTGLRRLREPGRAAGVAAAAAAELATADATRSTDLRI